MSTSMALLNTVGLGAREILRSNRSSVGTRRDALKALNEVFTHVHLAHGPFDSLEAAEELLKATKVCLILLLLDKDEHWVLGRVDSESEMACLWKEVPNAWAYVDGVRVEG